MAEHPTPGQLCYDAYWPHACVPWYTLHPHWQAAWEAAAQAVLAHGDHQRALACEVHQAMWAQIARCDCDVTGRAPVGGLCASCDSLKSLADAAQAVLAMQQEEEQCAC